MEKLHYVKPDVTFTFFEEKNVLEASGLDVGVDGFMTDWW